MKHTTSRMLFAYWDALRGERAAPERGAVQPGGMRHILADAFVLAADAPDGPAFRLAGSRCSALFGRDLRNVRFATLWPPSRRREADDMVELVTTETVGVVVGLRAVNENGSEVPLELVLLPLRHRGRPDVRVLGALSAMAVPSWAGLVPIATLETVGVRVVQTRREPEDDLPPSRRGLFVIHEGGRV